MTTFFKNNNILNRTWSSFGMGRAIFSWFPRTLERLPSIGSVANAKDSLKNKSSCEMLQEWSNKSDKSQNFDIHLSRSNCLHQSRLGYLKLSHLHPSKSQILNSKHGIPWLFPDFSLTFSSFPRLSINIFYLFCGIYPYLNLSKLIEIF